MIEAPENRPQEDRSPTPGRRYLLVSPCRDEAEYIRRTLDSITSQTLPPAKWVIVDDGSTDETPEILAEYAARFPYIEIVQKPDRGGRSVGPGVIEAFYYGYDRAEPERFDYVCKIDVDLDLPPLYFQRMVEKMEANPRIGTFSGKPYFPAPSNTAKDFAGELISEACGDETSVGMIKFYRRACFEEIGGFVREVMWDGIDCHKCRMLGWIAASEDSDETRFIHLRPMGSSHQGIFTGRMRHGFGQWFMGTELPYMVASSVFRMTRPPYVVGGAAILWGYLKSALEGKERFSDEAFREFLRDYQKDMLLKGKTRATRELNDRQARVWARRKHDADTK